MLSFFLWFKVSLKSSCSLLQYLWRFVLKVPFLYIIKGKLFFSSSGCRYLVFNKPFLGTAFLDFLWQGMNSSNLFIMRNTVSSKGNYILLVWSILHNEIFFLIGMTMRFPLSPSLGGIFVQLYVPTNGTKCFSMV